MFEMPHKYLWIFILRGSTVNKGHYIGILYIVSEAFKRKLPQLCVYKISWQNPKVLSWRKLCILQTWPSVTVSYFSNLKWFFLTIDEIRVKSQTKLKTTPKETFSVSQVSYCVGIRVYYERKTTLTGVRLTFTLNR